MGTGETVIGFDGHIDTVGVGNAANWAFDPFDGIEDDANIGGRGASDQLGGIASAVYGAARSPRIWACSPTSTRCS